MLYWKPRHTASTIQISDAEATTQFVRGTKQPIIGIEIHYYVNYYEHKLGLTYNPDNANATATILIHVDSDN